MEAPAQEKTASLLASAAARATGVPTNLPVERIFDGINEAISLLDTDWRYVYVNAHAERLSGMSRDRIIGQIIWELFPATIGTEFETAARRAVAEQRQVSFEYYFPTFGRWYEQRLYPSPDGLLLFTSDINQRKRLDIRVREGEQLYKQLFDATSEGILIVDDHGRYVDVNESYCRILKAPRECLIGAHFSDFIPPERLEEAISSFADLKNGDPTPLEFPLRAVDGSITLLEWTSVSHFLPGLSFCICRDKTEQLRARAALQQSEERQRRAIEAGKVGLWEWDIRNNQVTWSDYIYQLHGLNPGDFNGTVEAFSALIDPRDSNKVSEALERALAGQGEYHVEFRPLRPDGQPRWLETSGRVIFDGQGKPVLMHGAVIDTTARRGAEEVQREIERQLMLLIEASGALLASPHSSEVLSTITDLARRLVSADAHSVWRRHEDNVWRLRSSAGLSGEYLKTGFLNAAGASSLPTSPMLFEDVTAEPLLQQRREALAREGIRSMLAIPLRIDGEPSGTVVFYWKSVHKFTDSEVRIAAALGNLAASALGTAELYDRQLELRGEAQAAERRAAFLAEAGAILSSSLDFDVTLTSVAKLAVPIFADWASVDVLDQNSDVRRIAVAHSDPEKVRFAQQLAERYPPREDDPAMIAMRNGTSLIIEEVSDELIAERARDEEHLRIIRELALKSAIIAPIVAGQRSLGVITFVTAESGRHYTGADLQTAEELARRAGTALENARLYKESQNAQVELEQRNIELRRANEDLNQFAYSASHDLQEPLRMVSIYSELLKARYGGKLDRTAHQYIDYILEGSRRLEALLRDILQYTQAATPASAEIEIVDANAVLAQALTNLESGIAESGAKIAAAKLPMLRVQEIHLLQLLQNLIGNGIKYRSEKSPLIEVAAERMEEGWLFSVRDNGIGIDPQYKEQIFGLFKRLHSREEYAGTGVGLAICQKIVERYGGRIWVESEPGRGSTFFFQLPAAQ